MDMIANIDVDDLGKAIRFYQAAFGLKVGRSFGASGVEMLGGATPIWLLVKGAGTRASSTAAQVRSYERHWTPVHLDFVVEEIESAVQAAVSAVARLEAHISEAAWGKLAQLADPFGHGFCFSNFSDAATMRSPGGRDVASTCQGEWRYRRAL
jgi:uncharacterized glyoxalase superfamily protein PhnB